MANENRYFKTPFAESGDRVEVPDASVGGAVGFDTGFGSDYELPQGSVNKKRIERDKYNGLHHSITKNLKQWQEHIYPTWVEDAGAGTPFSYPVGMIVNHAGKNWVSNDATNTEGPGVGIKWSVHFDDWMAFTAALYAEAGITPSGLPDTAITSQRLEAIKRVVGKLSAIGFDTVADLRNSTSKLGTIASVELGGYRCRWDGYYSPSDGGSNWGIIKIGAHTDDGFSIFSLGANVYVEANLKGGRISVLKAGAKADSTQTVLVTDNAPIYNKVIDYLGDNGGGEVFTPAPKVAGSVYGLSTSSVNLACIQVIKEKILMSGEGEASILQTYNNAHVPIHICRDQDLTNPSPVGGELTGFEFTKMQVRGTGIYENFGLSKGRGILWRNAKKINIHHGWVTGMSMIGVCAEGGDGYFDVNHMQLHGNRYTAVNFNGRCYQSVVDACVISGVNGGVNSLAIQVTGHSIVRNCTVFGEISNTVNCGGISWGEGNYDGIGGISGCLVKHCSFGIKSVFHGAANITNNTIINCLNQGGISLVGTTTGAFTVGSSNNICSSNLIINCSPYGVDCSAPNTTFNGNKVRTFTPIINPSAGTEPDAIVGVTTLAGIRIRAAGCSVVGGEISGCTHGLLTTIDKANGVISGVEYKGNTYDRSIESASSGIIAANGVAVEQRHNIGGGKYRESIARSARPSQGYFEKSSEWVNPSPAIGAAISEIVLFEGKQTAAAVASAGATSIQLVSTSGWFASATATVCGIALDNGAWHWTPFSAVSSPNITIVTPIPAGRTVNIGASVIYNSWRSTGNLS